MTTRSKIFLGIFGAAAAGVVIGLLVAPEKGKEIRKRIKNSTGTWVNTLGRLFTKNKIHMDGSAEKETRGVMEVGS
jgi:gas vesicle protein